MDIDYAKKLNQGKCGIWTKLHKALNYFGKEGATHKGIKSDLFKKSPLFLRAFF